MWAVWMLLISSKHQSMFRFVFGYAILNGTGFKQIENLIDLYFLIFVLFFFFVHFQTTLPLLHPCTREYSSVHTQQPAKPVREVELDPYILLDDDIKYVTQDIRDVSIMQINRHTHTHVYKYAIIQFILKIVRWASSCRCYRGVPKCFFPLINTSFYFNYLCSGCLSLYWNFNLCFVKALYIMIATDVTHTHTHSSKLTKKKTTTKRKFKTRKKRPTTATMTTTSSAATDKQNR